MHARTHFFLYMLTLMTSLLLVSAAASQDGMGVIIEPNPSSSQEIDSLNPLLCFSTSCQRMAGLLFPTLFAADPATEALLGASESNRALVLDPALSEGDVQTLKLRDDLTWSDGAPVTAYDVLYSYLAAVSEVTSSPYFSIGSQITGARVVDEHTIALQFDEPDCSSFARANLPVIPAHVFDPEFTAFVDETNAANGDEIQSSEIWLEAYPETRFADLWRDDFNLKPTATAGIFGFDALRPAQDIRLAAGDTAFVYADVPPGLDGVQFFLSGQANVLINPPYERRDDLRATPGLQIAEYPGWTWDYILFNTADPHKPKDGLNKEGQPLDQGHHPLFGDVRVRRAVQLGIDVDELIDAAYDGNAAPIASSISPHSWAYNPELTPIGYDPVAAVQLLEEAGWKDYDRDGIRECHGCLYAEEGTLLEFELYEYPEPLLYIVGELIGRQLSRIGFYMDFYPESAESQDFDALLTSRVANAAPENGDPDQTLFFTRAGDKVGGDGNLGSYSNEQVEALMEAARTVPGCDMAARADLYRQIQAILHNDQPYAWLDVRTDMALAQPGVKGFNPLPGDPFWNIRDWVVQK